jgi:chromosome segregation ATPase
MGLKTQIADFAARCNDLNDQIMQSESLISEHVSKEEELQKSVLDLSRRCEQLSYLKTQVADFAARCDDLNDQMMQSESLISEHVSKEEELRASVFDLSRRCEQLSYQIVQADELRTASLLKEKEAQEHLLNLTKRCSHLEEVEAKLTHCTEQLMQLTKVQSEAQELKAYCDHLQTEKETLAAQIQQLQSDNQPKPDTVVSDRELRRIQGLYKQLREQFAEKSSTLDVTRKQLFLSEEKLAALQKEMEESRLYDEYEVDTHLSSLLTSAEKELVGTEHRYESEIQQLHEVIDRLIKVE